MKTYLLSFATSDFVKSNNVWTSGVIDLYSNKYYTNFSYTRSRMGLNSLGDYTFTGTKLLSGATPTIENAYAVTNYGEIYRDPNVSPHLIFNYNSIDGGNYVFSPDSSSTPVFTADSEETYLDRFIDTSSRIDIRTFKGAFSSALNSLESINFNVQVHESDSPARTMATIISRRF
jgi:hypothetical protein